jgi:hypothetical protein
MVNQNIPDFIGKYAIVAFFDLAFESAQSTNKLLIQIINKWPYLFVCKTLCKKWLFWHFCSAPIVLKAQTVVWLSV